MSVRLKRVSEQVIVITGASSGIGLPARTTAAIAWPTWLPCSVV